MKVRFVRPTLYFDINYWLFYEDPVTKEIVLFTSPLSTNLVESENPVAKLKSFLTKEFNSPIELEDLGDWKNIVSGSMIEHPFTRKYVLVQELPLKRAQPVITPPKPIEYKEIVDWLRIELEEISVRDDSKEARRVIGQLDERLGK